MCYVQPFIVQNWSVVVAVVQEEVTEAAVGTCSSLGELFSKLPSFAPPADTVSSARGLICEIVTCTVSVVCCKICPEQVIEEAQFIKLMCVFGEKGGGEVGMESAKVDYAWNSGSLGTVAYTI